MHVLQEVCVVIVFFISGITLKTDDMAKALSYRLELAYGMITILFTTSFLGFAFRALPLQPPEFATGERPASPLAAAAQAARAVCLSGWLMRNERPAPQA